MPSIPFKVQLSSGAITDEKISNGLDRIIISIRLSKDGGTADPTVTIKKALSGEVVLNGITLSSDKTYYPRVPEEDTDGTALSSYAHFIDAGQHITITVADGDTSGTVSGVLEFL